MTTWWWWCRRWIGSRGKWWTSTKSWASRSRTVRRQSLAPLLTRQSRSRPTPQIRSDHPVPSIRLRKVIVNAHPAPAIGPITSCGEQPIRGGPGSFCCRRSLLDACLIKYVAAALGRPDVVGGNCRSISCQASEIITLRSAPGLGGTRVHSRDSRFPAHDAALRPVTELEPRWRS